MRINRYIASAGLCSRRKADELIACGSVKVNGAVLTSPGYDVREGDVVEVNGRPVRAGEKKYYYALNKPVGYVTTMKDEYGRPTVAELMGDTEVRLFPVGRLDEDTSGLIFMTNDGDFAYRVSHPKHGLGKTYHAEVRGPLTRTKLACLRRGVDIGGFITSPARVRVLRELPGSTAVEITIHEGKNREIRRMFKAVGNPVLSLERVAIGPVRLGRLISGGCRRLRPEEISSLMER